MSTCVTCSMMLEHSQPAFYNRYFVKIDGTVAINHKKVAPNVSCIIDFRFTHS